MLPSSRPTKSKRRVSPRLRSLFCGCMWLRTASERLAARPAGRLDGRTRVVGCKTAVDYCVAVVVQLLPSLCRLPVPPARGPETATGKLLAAGTLVSLATAGRGALYTALLFLPAAGCAAGTQLERQVALLAESSSTAATYVCLLWLLQPARLRSGPARRGRPS